jgi:small subunit ribosomal protein S3
MGQKVNPIGLRIGIIEDWRSRWFAGKDYARYLGEDIKIREHISRKLARAGISKVEIERTGDRVKVDIFTARPGIVIGKGGSEVDVLRADVEKITKKQTQINIQEVKRPELDANLVAQNIAEQLEARVSFRRAMKKAVTSALRSGAQGVRVSCAGRLGGAEMARREWYREGRVPLHTLRANVDYGFAEAYTTFGRIGVKVWIYKGDILPTEEGKEILVEAKKKAAPEISEEESKKQGTVKKSVEVIAKEKELPKKQKLVKSKVPEETKKETTQKTKSTKSLKTDQEKKKSEKEGS